jgi:YVTN family beta-propeller protein
MQWCGRIALAVVAASGVTQCDSGTGPGRLPHHVRLTSSSTALDLDATVQVSATAYDADSAEIPGAEMVFSTSDPTVATVTAQGLVRGVGVGTVNVGAVAAANPLAFAHLPFRVRTRSIVITPGEVALSPGSTLSLTATVYGSTGEPITGASVTWSSVHPSVASVSPTGDLTAGAGLGHAQVTARHTFGSRTVADTIDVVVRARIPVSGRPYGLDVSPAGVVYVTLVDGAALARIDVAGLAVTRTVPVGFGPTQVAFNPAGDSAYVTNQLSGTVGVVDVAGDSGVGEAIPVAGAPFVVDVGPSGNAIYVVGNADSVFVLHAATRAVDTSLAVLGAPNGLAFHPTTPTLYVSASFGGTVTEINTASRAKVRTINVGGQPQGLVVAPNGSELYVANLAGRLDIISTVSGAVIGAIGLPGGAFGLALAPDGTTLYATLIHSGRVAVINRVTRAVLRILPVGGAPRRLGFDPASGHAVVANEAGFVDVVP